MSEPNSAYFYTGLQPDSAGLTQFDALSFLVTTMIQRVATATLVQVMGVTSSGDVAVPGTVDIQPLVNQLDGLGNSVPHGIIYKRPYCRQQAGPNAVIMDPQVGDIGLAIFCDHDISSVIAKTNLTPAPTQYNANPSTRRRYDMSDAVYVMGLLGKNGVPTQYVQFLSTGINLADVNGNQIQMGPSGISITGNVTLNGTFTATGDIQAGSISLEEHVHPGVESGSSDTGPPTG